MIRDIEYLKRRAEQEEAAAAASSAECAKAAHDALARAYLGRIGALAAGSGSREFAQQGRKTGRQSLS